MQEDMNTMDPQKNFAKRSLKQMLCHQMEHCLVELLQTKVLYQNISFEPPATKRSPKPGTDAYTRNEVLEEIQRESFTLVGPDIEKALPGFCGPVVHAPKTVCTICEFCKGEPTPHNPILALAADRESASSDQTFVFSYQCQKCKRGTLVFLVRRRGFKLQLVGRNQVPSPTIPASFPKEQLALFTDAEMAYRTGSHLAAICLLRIALEQFLRAKTGIAEASTGDKLWDAFKQKLPSDFPLGRVVCLGDIYGRLSEIVHDPSRLEDASYPSFKQDLEVFFNFLALLPLNN